MIEFRDRWVDPNRRTDLVSALPHGAESLGILQTAGGLDECDEYDVVAGEIFGETARRKVERAERLERRQASWLRSLGGLRADVLVAMSRQFGLGGTAALESPELFNLPTIRAAGGNEAIQGEHPPPSELLRELKRRLLATDDEWRAA